MARDDFILNDGTGIGVRTKLHNMCEALRSNSSGVGAPTEGLEEGQFWLDMGVTPWNLYIWDGANSLLIGTIHPSTHTWTAVGALSAWVGVPATITSTGTTGQYSSDNEYFYICTGTDRWRRCRLSTW